MSHDLLTGWRDFCEGFSLSAVIPKEYACYETLIRDGLLFFLERLPSERLIPILEEQARFPFHCGVIPRIAAIMHRCPTLHKLGQVLARDRHLSQDFRRSLQTFESMEPITPLAEVCGEIERGLGASRVRDLRLATQALAEASVAVVLPFSWNGHDGVLKVLKPGIEQRLHEDLNTWKELGSFLDERCATYGLPPLDYSDALQRVRVLLINEVRLDKEQAHLREAAKFYQGAEQVRIPELLPFCSPRITAMQRLTGVKVTEASENRSALAGWIIRALLARPVLMNQDKVMFHADAHAGNLLACDQGQLGILDWSLVGHLSRHHCEQVAQILLAALMMDPARLGAAIESLAMQTPKSGALRNVVEQALCRIRSGALPGLNWLVKLLDDAVFQGGVRFDSDLLMFRKTVLTLDGVVSDLAPNYPVDLALMFPAMERFCNDIPSRAFALPSSRSFATHLSNLDLWTLSASLPLTAMRFCTGMIHDYGGSSCPSWSSPRLQ